MRDLDVFMAPRRPPRIWTAPDLLRVVGNRGASGIDGLVATTLGVAAGSPGPTFALLGDLSFLVRRGLAPVVLDVSASTRCFVVLANGGGQIFSMLDQALAAGARRAVHDAAPGIRSARLCRGRIGGARSGRARRRPRPGAGAGGRDGGVQVVEVAIDAERDRARRAELRAAVAAALAGR